MRSQGTRFMNALHTLYIVSHLLRVSRYGAHTSLSSAERVEIIDALSDTCTTGVKILTQLKQARQQMEHVSFLPVKQLLHRLVKANIDYVDFLILRITDLGGYAEAETLHRVYDVRDTKRFPECIQGIHLETERLFALDALLRDWYERAIAHRDTASEQFFKACVQQNKLFISLIEDNLLNDWPL